MTTATLIQCGIYDNLRDVFEQFPLEFLEDFGNCHPLGGFRGRWNECQGGRYSRHRVFENGDMDGDRLLS